jgi:hypothetical protein
MRSRLLLAALLLVALQPNIAPATVVLVPEIRTTIQGGVDLASNGDTVSVWGPPPGQPSVPPWTYYENVSFLTIRVGTTSSSTVAVTARLSRLCSR